MIEYGSSSDSNWLIDLLLKLSENGKVKKLFLDENNSVYQYKQGESYSYLIIINHNYTFVSGDGIIQQIARDVVDK